MPYGPWPMDKNSAVRSMGHGKSIILEVLYGPDHMGVSQTYSDQSPNVLRREKRCQVRQAGWLPVCCTLAGPVTGTDTRWGGNEVWDWCEGLRVRWTGVQKRSERTKARQARVQVRSKREGVEGPKSEVGALSAQRTWCETKSRPRGVRQSLGREE